jgi:hypothetical protein
MPVVLLGATEDLQVLFKGLVGSFTDSINLRMICQTDILMDVKKTAEFYGKFRCEADILV